MPCDKRFEKVSFEGPTEQAVGGKKGMTPLQSEQSGDNPGKITFFGEKLRIRRGEPVDYKPQIKIKAPDDATASQYEVGFAANVVTSDRHAEYAGGKTVSKVVSPLPIRDAHSDADPVFISAAPTATKVESFTSANDTRKLIWPDLPGGVFGARLSNNLCSTGSNRLIKKMVQAETFLFLVVVRHKPTGCIRPLQHVRWGVDFFAKIVFEDWPDATFKDVRDKNFVSAQGDGKVPFVQGGPTAGDSVKEVCPT